ncbi:MAG TPA: DUF4350 domain-containing protein [Euzebyales bacterium]
MTTPQRKGHGPGTAPEPHDVDDQVLWRWVWHRARRHWALLTLAAAILATAALTATMPDDGLPLDPTATGADGTRALVDVLAALGRPAGVVDPGAIGDADVVLLLRDQLTTRQREHLRERVRAGARVVVADPASELVPDTTARTGLLHRRLTADCDLSATLAAREIRPGSGAALFETPDDAAACFPAADGAWLVAEPLGRGHVIALGDPSPLTNARLAVADHAPLVVGLLTPGGGREIEIVRPVLRTAGDDETLSDLVPTGVRTMVGQLLLAFGVVVLWRARRLGRPLRDASRVRLPSSDLTAAVGALLARNRTRSSAARRIVAGSRRRLTRQLGLSPDAADDEVARAVAAVTGEDAGRVTTLLDPPPPTDDPELLEIASGLATLEQVVERNLTLDMEPADAD